MSCCAPFSACLGVVAVVIIVVVGQGYFWCCGISSGGSVRSGGKCVGDGRRARDRVVV